MTAITSLTAQNTTGVRSIMPASPSIVTDQIDMVMEDIPPMAVKTGMLCNAEVAGAVAERLKHYHINNLVIDPVMVSTSGSRLLSEDAIALITREIFPLSTLITPNKSEAAALTGEDDPDRQAAAFSDMGCRNILLKGGDTSDRDFKTDILYLDNCKKRIEPAGRCHRHVQHTRDRLHTLVSHRVISRLGLQSHRGCQCCQAIHHACSRSRSVCHHRQRARSCQSFLLSAQTQEFQSVNIQKLMNITINDVPLTLPSGSMLSDALAAKEIKLSGIATGS